MVHMKQVHIILLSYQKRFPANFDDAIKDWNFKKKSPDEWNFVEYNIYSKPMTKAGF